jgi:anion-transporting  ArsA/GET3 family ATPase
VRDAPVNLLERRLLLVTGKGGTGKTTVTAALAEAALASGRRVLVCEMAGRAVLPEVYGRAPADRGVVQLSPGLWQLSLDPADALREWLRRQPGGAAVAAVLMGSATFQHFVAAGPGVKELVTMGKLGDLVGSGRYDVVVVDAPASGHVVGLVTAPRTFAQIARGGVIRRDAAALWELVRDRRRTGYVGVALPEEMAVRELLELDAGLTAEIGRGLDRAVVNEVWPDRFDEDDAARLREVRDHVTDRHEIALLETALAAHRRASAHGLQVAGLRAELDVPVAILPERFTDRLGPADYAAFGTLLSRAEAPAPLAVAAARR